MPTRFNLEIPPGLSPADYERVLNERMRTIQDELEAPIKLDADLDAGGKRIVNLGTPSGDLDAVTRRYAQGLIKPATSAAMQANATTVTPTPAATATAGQLLLFVPGILSVRSSAAMLVKLMNDRTPTGVSADLKRPAQGGDITFRLKLDGASWAQMTIPAGNTQGEISAVGLNQLTKTKLIVVDILAVPQTFPGADLTISIGLG